MLLQYNCLSSAEAPMIMKRAINLPVLVLIFSFSLPLSAQQGAWGERVIYEDSSGPLGAWVVDLNLDGYPDLISRSVATGGSSPSEIRWAKNLGASASPRFGPHQVLSSSTSAMGSIGSMSWSEFRDLHFADYTGNGLIDIICMANGPSGSQEVILYGQISDSVFGDPQVIFVAAAPTSAGALGMTFGDLTGDGVPDILVYSLGLIFNSNLVASPVLNWHQGDGTGGFLSANSLASSALPTTFPTGFVATYFGAMFARLADTDSDGDLDILMFTQAPDTSSITNSSYRMALRENRLNELTADFAPEVLIEDDGSLLYRPSDMEVVDVDGDGDLDIFTASNLDDRVAFYENVGPGNGTNGSGFAAQHALTATGWYPNSNGGADGAYAVASGDMDGDGDLDVLAACYNDDKLCWYENLGGATFGPEKIITLCADNSNGVATGDIDQDGKVDVAGTSSLDGKFAWYKNYGTAAYSGSGSDLELGASIYSSATGAFPLHTNAPQSHIVVDGDQISVLLSSCGGTYTGSLSILAAQVYPDGFILADANYPEVHLSLGASALYPIITIAEAVLSSSGIAYSTTVPVGLAGSHVRFQGVALSPAAPNHIFAASGAQDFWIQ